MDVLSGVGESHVGEYSDGYCCIKACFELLAVLFFVIVFFFFFFFLGGGGTVNESICFFLSILFYFIFYVFFCLSFHLFQSSSSG